MKCNRSGQSAIISDLEYSKIRRQINNLKFRLLLDVGWYTGERWGAIVQLKVSDIYQGDGKTKDFITFRAVTRKASPNGVRATRQVPIHLALAEILRNYKPTGEWMFPNKLDPTKHITLRSGDLILRSAVQKAGFANRGFSSHSTRRSFITKLHRAGVDIYTIQSVTGHKDLQSLRRYVEITPERVKNAINLI